MKKLVCLALALFLLCAGCTFNCVRNSSGVNIDARKDITVTDPSTTIGLPVL